MLILFRHLEAPPHFSFILEAAQQNDNGLQTLSSRNPLHLLSRHCKRSWSYQDFAAKAKIHREVWAKHSMQDLCALGWCILVSIKLHSSYPGWFINESLFTKSSPSAHSTADATKKTLPVSVTEPGDYEFFQTSSTKCSGLFHPEHPLPKVSTGSILKIQEDFISTKNEKSTNTLLQQSMTKVEKWYCQTF